MIVPRRYAAFFWPLTFTIIFALAGLVSWGFLTEIPLTVKARGMILPIGGIRELTSTGAGVVASRDAVNGQQVQAGELLITLYDPNLEAEYQKATDSYLSTIKHLALQEGIALRQRDRTINEKQSLLRSAEEQYLLLQNLQLAFSASIENLIKIEQESLQDQEDTLENVLISYNKLVEGLTALKRKGYLSETKYVDRLDTYGKTLRTMSELKLRYPKAVVERNRMEQELNQLLEKDSQVKARIRSLQGSMENAREDYQIAMGELALKRLDSRQQLLDAERLLWLNTHLISPYIGKLLSVNKTIGDVIKRAENIALLDMQRQERMKMLVISPSAYSGTIRMRTLNGEVQAELKAANKQALFDDLFAGITQLFPNLKLKMQTFDERMVLMVEQGDASLLNQLELVTFNLKTLNDLQAFCLLSTIGDSWQQDELVNIAVVRAKDAKLVEPGATALIKPDYEKTLLGSKVKATVTSISNYSVTAIEAEALIGSRELAQQLMGDKGGLFTILKLTTDVAGNLQWHGTPSVIPLGVGTTTETSIEVKALPPIEIIIPFIADLFSRSAQK